MTASPASVSPSHVEVLEEIGEVRSHLLDPLRELSSAPDDEGHALAAACYALPGYAREIDRLGRPRLWPYECAFATGGRRDELLQAAAHGVAALEMHYLEQRQPKSRAAIFAHVGGVRDQLVGPVVGDDPTRSTRESAIDALAFAAACYALPNHAREVGIHGIPLLWPWPRRLWMGLPRESELVLALAMLVGEIERSDWAGPGRRPSLRVLAGGQDDRP